MTSSDGTDLALDCVGSVASQVEAELTSVEQAQPDSDLIEHTLIKDDGVNKYEDANAPIERNKNICRVLGQISPD